MASHDQDLARIELLEAEEELINIRKRVTDLRRKVQAEPIPDYTLKDRNGNPALLSSCFGNKNDLIVIHNMGKECVYCTLWADGFNGVWRHIEDRAGFVVVSHDDPSTMKVFAESRGWEFRMLSNAGGPFARDMGFESPDHDPFPGVSTFFRNPDGSIVRVAHTGFGPGDDFCAVWHLLDMLRDGSNKWAPKYTY
jgi:predicted dithiol-disulfide oxidoreductase (DUF899 family)